MPDFKVVSDFSLSEGQKKSVTKLCQGIKDGFQFQTLKGVTASGKTYTFAKIIEQMQLPTIVFSHNKTLAAQLYRDLSNFFPANTVEYFVSYYDYFQPEAYVPGRDLYIEKEATINQEIDRMRLAATASLLERQDVIVVATVSCIYGIGNPDDYQKMQMQLKKDETYEYKKILTRFVALQYSRNDAVLERSNFRVRGDIIEVYPSYAKNALRIEFYGDQIERIRRINPVSGNTIEELTSCIIYPAKYFVTSGDRIRNAVNEIKIELKERYHELLEKGKQLEAQRLKSRTEYDIEMLEEMGYCAGIENYSRYIAGRKAGQRPAVLLDFFPDEYLFLIDESHVSVPQIRSMYYGDYSRKKALVEHGFRLPSALDNRPLFFEEFESLLGSTIFISATPRQFELEKSKQVVEQIIRPTGLVDPELEVRPSSGQIDDIYAEINKRIKIGERSLVTTLTKKMAEDLADYLGELGLKVQYLHSEIKTIERVEILRDLRKGVFDVLIGVNLLREGLDLPEVSFIAILDADKIGFLRSATSLIQIIGRAARNVNGKVIMYADTVSDAMKEAIEETDRRRKIQIEYNEEHGITPKTIKKAIHDILVRKIEEKKDIQKFNMEIIKKNYNILIPKQKKELVKRLEQEMLELAKDLEFERAAVIRDEIKKLQEI